MLATEHLERNGISDIPFLYSTSDESLDVAIGHSSKIYVAHFDLIDTHWAGIQSPLHVDFPATRGDNLDEAGPFLTAMPPGYIVRFI